MPRILSPLLLLAVAGVALANIPPMPPKPAKGKKFVPVENTVKLDKELKGYAVYVWTDPVQREPPVPLAATSEKAAAVPGSTSQFGIRRVSPFLVVPEAMVEKLKTPADWRKVVGVKDSGVFRYDFKAEEEVDEKDERKAVPRAFVLKSIDPKDGIKLEEVKEDKKDEKKPEDKKPVGLEPGYVVGGIAAAAAVCFGGLWLVRRRK